MEKNEFKKSYTRAEVEEYVKKMLASSEVTMCEQKDRIVELKKRNDELRLELQQQAEKHKTTTKAMNELNRSVKSMHADFELQKNIMVEKLKLFSFKWGNYFVHAFENCDNLKADNGPIVFESEFAELIDQVLELDNTGASTKEKKIPRSKKNLKVEEKKWLEQSAGKLNEPKGCSLSAESEERYKVVMNKLKNQMLFVSELQKPTDDGFNIDEALNPTDSLDDIIEELNDGDKIDAKKRK